MASGAWARTDRVTVEALGNTWVFERADAVEVQRWLPTFWRIVQSQEPLRMYREQVAEAEAAGTAAPVPSNELAALWSTAGCTGEEIEVFADQLAGHLVSVDDQAVPEGLDTVATIRRRLSGREMSELWFGWIEAQQPKVEEKKG